MYVKFIKWGAIGVIGIGTVGGALFGSEAISYLRSSAGAVQTAVKDSVPIEFELRRARDLLSEIIPEMHANVKLIAQEEVEIESLKYDIDKSRELVEEQQKKIVKLRNMLDTRQVSFQVSGQDYDRIQVKTDLERRFARFKEAKVVLAGKERLLKTRQQSLHSAMQMLDRVSSQKVLLEDQIASLEGQHRLVKAASVGSTIKVDNSRIAQTEKLIKQIKNRLDVAERVLSHESRFVESIPVDVIDEGELLTEVDEFIFGESTVETVSADAVEVEELVQLSHKNEIE